MGNSEVGFNLNINNLNLKIMAEMNKPQTIAVIGEVITVKTLLKADFMKNETESKLKHDCKVVTIDSLDGTPNTEVFVTLKQWNRYGLEGILFEGNVVNVTLEQCIEGVTTYADENGIIQHHLTSYNAFVNAVNVGELSLIRVFGMLGVAPAIVADFIKDIINKRNIKLAQIAKSRPVIDEIDVDMDELDVNDSDDSNDDSKDA